MTDFDLDEIANRKRHSASERKVLLTEAERDWLVYRARASWPTAKLFTEEDMKELDRLRSRIAELEEALGEAIRLLDIARAALSTSGGNAPPVAETPNV